VLRRLASWCHRHRKVVVLLWLIALVGLSLVAKSVGSAYSQGIEVGGTESQQAASLLKARFAAKAGDEGQIVFAADSGVTDPAVQARVEQLFADVVKVPGVTGVTSPFTPQGIGQTAKDGKVAFATVQFAKRASQVSKSTISDLRKLASKASGDGVQVELGGRMFQERPDIGASELIGIAAAIIILLVAFGSLLAMGLPILIALFGIGVGFALVALSSHIFVTPDMTTQLASMIGIGVGIDYALFIVTRYRQGLDDGLEPHAATVRAIDTAGRAVLFAGTTVVISLLGLFIMGVSFVNGLAIGSSITVAVVMVASITLLPALLGFVGRSIDRFSVGRRKPKADAGRQSVWYRWSRVVQHHPWISAAAGLLVLLVLAIPMLSMRLAFPDDGANPKADTTRRAYDLVTAGFGAGFNGPLVLAAEFPKGADTAALTQLSKALAATPGVAFASPAVPSPSGDAAVIRVIPTTAPQSQETENLVHTIRNEVIPKAVAGTDLQVKVGGITASSIDVAEQLSSRLPWFIGGVLVLSFLLLMAVFRSLLVPLKAVIMNLLSIGAAYGLVVAVFEWGWFADVVGLDKTGPIAPFIPMMMFAILFGLSMDYEVFLLSRIREEYDRTHDNATAVADGLAATARVITAAALIMVTVFASFVIPDGTMIKLFGAGLAFAIFIDATVVRMVLVPATMELLGDKNWWFPKWLDRIVPRLHVEAIDDVDQELRALDSEGREAAPV
jgi:putative drug exporter of the RND superfamily